MLTYGLHVKRNLYCRLWNWDSLQEYASQGNRASPALPGCSHSRNCPPPFEAGVTFTPCQARNVPPAMSWPEGGTRSRSPLNRSTMQIDRAPAGTEPTCPQDSLGGHQPTGAPVYRRIHSAIDITTAYELGAD